MKIAIIGTAHPFRGGIAHFNERLSKELVSLGHTVKIINFTIQYPKILFPGKTQLSDDEKPPGLEIERSINSINPLNWLLVGNRIKKENYELVIIPFWLPLMGPSLATIGRIVKQNKTTKVISIVHNAIPHESRIGDKWFTKYFISAMHGFIAMTQKVKDDLQILGTNKLINLTPHPIYDDYGTLFEKNMAQSRLNLSPDNNYLLFFGLVRDYKGLDLLIKAMAMVKVKKLKLIIAGEFYSNKAYYQQLIDELNIKHKIIIFDSYIPNDQVATFFSACDLVVQPYKTATQSGVTQIAYHFEKPMIVTNVGGLKEMCPNGKAGYVVEPNENDISDAITKFYTNDVESHMKTEIINIKKAYSWSIFVENIFSLTDKIDNEHKRTFFKKHKRVNSRQTKSN